MDDRMGCIRVQFHTVGIFVADDITGKFHNGKLHSETETKERDIVGTCITDCFDLPLYTAVAKSARNKNTADISK